MPLSIVLLLFFVCGLAVWQLKNRVAKLSITVAFVLLWASSTPALARHLYQWLESIEPAVSLESLPVGKCAVVLGGAVAAVNAPDARVRPGPSADRMYTAVQLYRIGKISTVIVAAGNQPWSQPGPSEAALIGELLVGWGVPVEALRLEGNSRNTRENALNSLPILSELRCSQPLLVTSAAHMPRALRAFKVLGIDAIPVSADVKVDSESGLAMTDFFPDAHSLAMTSDAIREWTGQKVYEWRGWN